MKLKEFKKQIDFSSDMDDWEVTDESGFPVGVKCDDDLRHIVISWTN